MQVIYRLRQSRFAIDTASMLSGRFLTVFVGILTSIVIARILGPSNKGAVTAVLSLPLLVLSFGELGLRQATTYIVGKQKADEQDVISTLAFLLLPASALGIIIVLGVSLYLGYPQKYGWMASLIALLLIPFGLASRFAFGFLMGKRRLREIAFRDFISAASIFLLIMPLTLVEKVRIEGVLAANVLGTLVGTIFMIRAVKQYGHLVPRYIRNLPLMLFRLGFVYAFALFIMNLHYRIDIVLLEHLSNTEQVGVYSVAVNLAEMLWLFSAALQTVNFSYSAVAKEPSVHSTKTARLVRVVLWGSVGPCLALYFAAPLLIKGAYGDAYAASGNVVRAILPGIWISVVLKVLNSDLAGQGRPNAALYTHFCALALNIVLNLWWIPLYGAIGSAWASSLSYSFGAAIYAIAYAHMNNISIKSIFVLNRSDITSILQVFKKAGKKSYA